MKIEINDDDLINAIAAEVVKRLTPLLVRDLKDTGDELMTVEELSKYLKVTKSFVYDKIHTGKIPVKKVGKLPRFRKKDIDKWILNPYSPGLEINNSNIAFKKRE